MKILYVTTISNTVNAFLIPHILFLIDRGHEVDVAFNEIQEINPVLIRLGCKIHQVEFQRNPLNFENITAYRKIKKLIKEEEYQVIHVHTPVASFLTRLACRSLKDVKVLYTAHGFHFFYGAPKKNWVIYHTLEKIAARWTDGLIAMNDEDYNAAKKLPLRKRDGVYKVNGVGLDLYKFSPQTFEKKQQLRKQYGFHEDDFILTYVAELSYRKNQDLLLYALNKVNEKLENCKLLLVGDGHLMDQYRELVERLNLTNEVKLLGYRDDVHQLMTITDIAVSTSRQEGLPVNVMEAMATGLPLIVTNCRGNRDLVKDGVNGYVVNIDDVDACANAIVKLYQSEQVRQQFAQKNREVIQLYSLDYVIDEMKAIYKAQLMELQERHILEQYT